MVVSTNGGISIPKWMDYKGKNPITMDDLGVPLFQETSISQCLGPIRNYFSQFQIEVSLWHWQFSMWLQWVSGFIPHKKPHPSCHDGNQVARHRDCIFCDECTTKALQRALGGKEKNLGKTVRRKPSAFIKHSGLRNPVMKNGNGGSHQTLCWGIFQHDMWLISRG